ncbi:nuclear pore complex protein Nup133 [Culicoides brevitarsis]|uniref:nuclear pore complex protein Nup133 n=1 Tax=Culicoides brevitarsis TaxID=469753 RepID=UPI00307CB97E
MEFNQQRFSRLSGVGVKSSSSPLFSSRSVSAISMSGRSTTSAALQIQAQDYCVNTYGLPYPVQINEALTFGKNSSVSINCSSNGFAWAVCGRKLFIWQYKEPRNIVTPQRRTIAGQCRVLTLPHCDIGNKADLVTVFVSEGHQSASCLASSPTGDIRFWQSINHDNASVNQNGILEGQEFDQLIKLAPNHYLLSTTTCQLVVLQIDGRQQIKYRIVRSPQGFLAGIGRRFSSIVGFSGTNDKENKLIKICSEKVNQSTFRITVLADRFLQEWTFTESMETFGFEDPEILRKVREFYNVNVWKNRDTHELKLWLLDMRTFKNSLIILSAAVNPSVSPQIEYGLLIFGREGETVRLLNGYNLKHKGFYKDEKEGMDLRFIVSHGMAYVYDEKFVYPVFITGHDLDEAESIEFKGAEDKILAAVSVQDLALFFSRTHGIISVTPSDFDPSELGNNVSMSQDHETTFNESMSMSSFREPNANQTMSNLSMYDYNPEEIMQSHDDVVHKLKAAFLYYVKRNTIESTKIIENLLDESENLQSLDYAIVAIAKEIATDTPAQDPRWKMIQPEDTFALGRSTSMQILTQLKDKSAAFKHFVDFLHATSIWERLATITEQGTTKSTFQLLSDVNEQIEAAIGLKSIHDKHTKLINEAIEIVLKEKRSTPVHNLTNQDLFYVNVSHMRSFLHALVKIIQNQVSTEGALPRLQSLLIDVDTIVLTILSAITKFRAVNAGRFEAPTDKIHLFEYLPWTNITGKQGAYDPLMELIKFHIKESFKSVGPVDIRKKMYLQLSELVDFILNSKERYLASINDGEKRKILKQKFEALRTELISAFVESENYDIATKLAEKYLDFQALVQVADRTNDEARLAEYNEKFKEYNFAQYAINWHLRQNKQGTIFQRFKHDQPALTQFLGDHPSLAWIQHIMKNEQDKASHILYALAQNEKELVSRKKTLLSLAKLSAIATDSQLAADIQQINSELVLIQHQEQLPPELLLNFGYDVQNQKVLTPEEIINLYISDENVGSEEDFRKALELLQYVEDPVEVQSKIWCAAILRDDWEDYSPDEPLEKIQNMTFFKLIDLCYLLDGDLNQFLPPLQVFLNAPELASISDSKKFQYLIKLGYEHVLETYQSTRME